MPRENIFSNIFFFPFKFIETVISIYNVNAYQTFHYAFNTKFLICSNRIDDSMTILQTQLMKYRPAEYQYNAQHWTNEQSDTYNFHFYQYFISSIWFCIAVFVILCQLNWCWFFHSSSCVKSATSCDFKWIHWVVLKDIEISQLITPTTTDW